MLDTGLVVGLRRLIGAIRTALNRHAGLLRLLRRMAQVLRREGLVGLDLRLRLLLLPTAWSA